MENNIKTILLDSCASTMDEAKKYAQQNRVDSLFCVATRVQTAGRGRGGSTWSQLALKDAPLEPGRVQYESLPDALARESDFLPLTLILPTQQLKIPIEWISIAVGCALYDALENAEEFLRTHFFELPFKDKEPRYFIKWPNDLIVMPSGKKIAGILCESSVLSGQVNEIFIGIGLNFFSHPDLENSTSFFESLFHQTAQAEKSTKKLCSDKQFVQSFLMHFAQVLCAELKEYLCYARDVTQLKNLALARFLPKGTRLSVNKGSIKGEFATLADNGALILEGVKEPIYSGDIALEASVTNKLEPAILQGIKNSALKEKKAHTEKKSQRSILAIDFGNTRIHMAHQNSIGGVKRVNVGYTVDLGEVSALRPHLKEILENLVPDKNEVVFVVYTSVTTNEITKNSLKNLLAFFQKIFPEIKLQEFKITEKEVFEKVPLGGHYEAIHIGADRALKFYFAFHQAKLTQKNTLIFSFGTAVTCEGVSPNGEMLENYVFPGIQMSFDALHNATALLPALQADPSLYSPDGKEWTQEIYLQRGVFMSVLGAVLATARMHEPCVCYLSGGNADQVMELIKDVSETTRLPLEFHAAPHLETSMMFKLANESWTPRVPVPDQRGLTSEGAKNLELQNPLTGMTQPQNFLPPRPSHSVLSSMLKARLLEKKERNITPRLEDFRKIGGRIENSNFERIDMYMSHKFKFHNREEWHQRIENHEIMIEHNATREFLPGYKAILNKVKPTYKIKNYDQIWLFHPPEYEPEFLESIDVVYDDKDVCIFSKPPNLVVHSTGLYLKNTFIEIIAKMGYKDCSPVHRIDRETSGILACARNAATRKSMSDAFRYSQVQKMYLAISKGTRELPSLFKVELPIGDPENSIIRLKLWVHGQNSLPAATHFAKLATVDDYTLFACLPVTGRTNQIRVHLAAIGHWIVGDKMYHEDENVFIEFYEKGFTPWVQERVLFPRHMLHNAGIMMDADTGIAGFSGEPIVCPVPDDMFDFSATAKLLEKANMPRDREQQMERLKELFVSLQATDFSTQEVIS